MKTFSPLLIIILMMTLSSCHLPSAPKNVAIHPALPQKFEYHGLPAPIFGGRTALVFENGYLARREYELKDVGNVSKDVLSSTEYFVPTQSQWETFWQSMNELSVWKWRKEYAPADIGVEVYDGGGWHLILEHQGHKVDTQGYNAGPKLGAPQKTVIRSDALEQVDQAIATLTGPPQTHDNEAASKPASAEIP